MTDLSRHAMCASGTLYYHLERLRTAERVLVTTAGRRRLAFLADAVPDQGLVTRLAQLQGHSAGIVAHTLLGRPGVRLAEVEAATGLSRRAVTYQVRQLERIGLAWTTRHHDGTRAGPTAQLATFLEDDTDGPS